MDARNYQVGMVVNAVSAKLDRKKTSPPPYYTEDTLLEDMCSAHKFAKTDADRQILKEVAGIGTSRTRGAVIQGLVNRQLIVSKKVGKSYQLRDTPAARDLLTVLPDEMKDVAMTAKWERALGMVAHGQAAGGQLKTKISDVLQGLVVQALAAAGEGAPEAARIQPRQQSRQASGGGRK